ncbi:MAG: hypothetical protein ACI9LU_000828 [Polaribacter sp.]|jgi:hypothetical protein
MLGIIISQRIIRMVSAQLKPLYRQTLNLTDYKGQTRASRLNVYPGKVTTNYTYYVQTPYSPTLKCLHRPIHLYTLVTINLYKYAF